MLSHAGFGGGRPKVLQEVIARAAGEIWMRDWEDTWLRAGGARLHRRGRTHRSWSLYPHRDRSLTKLRAAPLLQCRSFVSGRRGTSILSFVLLTTRGLIIGCTRCAASFGIRLLADWTISLKISLTISLTMSLTVDKSAHSGQPS